MTKKLACIFNTKIKFYTSLIVSYNKYWEYWFVHAIMRIKWDNMNWILLIFLHHINSRFSKKVLKIASKKSVGFDSLFYKFCSATFLKCFFMIATATTATPCLNYNPIPLFMLPFFRLFFRKMLFLVNTQTNNETACNIF